MTLENDAQIQNGLTTVAKETASRGEILMTGINTTWSMDGLIVAERGHGTAVFQGGAVTVDGIAVGRYEGAHGELRLSEGAQWEFRSSAIGYEGFGKLTIEGGARAIASYSISGTPSSSIGLSSTGEGEVLVSGAGSEWQPTGYFYVGRLGKGKLTIANGGRVAYGEHGLVGARIGFYSASFGEALVTGEDSTWIVPRELRVGVDGDGSLRIEKGGRLELVALSWRDPLDAGLSIGGAGSGHVTVTGVYSEVRTAGGLSVNAKGTLEILDGAAVSSYVGIIAGSAVVAGTNSTWNATRYISASNLSLRDGASAASPLMLLGAETLVSDIGTRLSGADIRVGRESSSSPNGDRLTVRDGAIVSATHLQINPTGLLTGHNGTIIGDVTNSGTIAPGNSPGVLTIDGDLIQTPAGRLAFEIAGPEAFDQLVVTGHASLAGTLSLELLDGYVPALGTAFQLFDFGSADGELTLEFPRLGGGLGWDPRQLISDGVIRVAPMSAIPEPSGGIAVFALLLAAAVRCKLKICNLHFAMLIAGR